MKSFNFDGKEYRSLRVCCSELGVSYQKLRRLCRHYVRASQDSAVAIRWLLGIEVRSWNEPKTEHYSQDLQKSKERQWRFKDKITDEIRSNF